MSKIGNYLEFHAQALNLRSRRNEILASNIANAATPHFKARDLNFEQEIQRHIKHAVSYTHLTLPTIYSV